MAPTERNAEERIAAGGERFDRVVLTGFMGSGKSTVGRMLASRTGWAFVDLDREIERREGRSIPAIFAESGEARFRELERGILAEALRRKRTIVALGGGAVEDAGSRGLLANDRSAVVLLHAPFEVLVARCKAQAEEPGAVLRPVLADAEQASRRFRQRVGLYAQIATHTLETSQQSAAETVAAIVRLVGLD